MNNYFQIGVPLLQHLLPRGQAPGEVYMLLGPIGIGKSTLATMITWEGMRYTAQDGSRGIWFFFDFEMNRRDVSERLSSYGGRIARESLAASDIVTDLSNMPRAYENAEELCQAGFDQNDPEVTRFLFARELANRHFRYVNAATKFGHQNPTTLCEQIATSIVAQHICPTDKVAGVILDSPRRWALAEIAQSDSAHATQIVQDMLAGIRPLIARRFNCPVWYTYHLDAVGARKPPSQIATHGNAADVRCLSSLIDGAIVMGNEDPSTNVFRMAVTKARGLTGPRSVFAKMSDVYWKIEEVPDAAIKIADRGIARPSIGGTRQFRGIIRPRRGGG